MNAKRIRLFVVASLAAAAWSAEPAEAATAATNAPAQPLVIPKSEFTPVRDPFFPSRSMGGAAAVKAGPTQTQPAVEPAELILRQLLLRGLTRNPDGKRLASISGPEGRSVDFETGEIRELRVDGKVQRIKCLEILNTSVVVSLEGSSQRKEIRLREGM